MHTFYHKNQHNIKIPIVNSKDILPLTSCGELKAGHGSVYTTAWEIFFVSLVEFLFSHLANFLGLKTNFCGVILFVFKKIKLAWSLEK